MNADLQVVAAIVEGAYKTGARKVNIFDVTCNDVKKTR